LKEVIIDDPDYIAGYKKLVEITETANKFTKDNNLDKLPSIKDVFFKEKDNTIYDLNEKLESLIEEFGNSRNKKVIQKINDYPVLSIDTIVSPAKKKWINILLLVIVPAGIFIYLRTLKFRLRLAKDLAKVQEISNVIIEILNKEKLV
jgi:lipopolysaccharide export system permease protein